MKRIERHDKIYSMCIDSECTFKPDTAKTRYKYKHSKSRYRKSFVSEKPLIEKYNSENFDQTTGQPFFRPKVGRSPMKKSHRSSKSIGNLLYDNNKVYKDRKQQLVKNHNDEIKQQLNTKHCKKSSEVLLEKMKNKRFSDLFEILDSNGDGLISAQKIDISNLKPEVLEAMMPLFCEMEEMGQTLDCREFTDSLKRLYTTLSVTEKNQLLATSHKWDLEREMNQIEHSFEPHINKRSKRMASNRMLEGEAIEDHLVRKRNELDDKLNRIRHRKRNDELKG